MSAYLVIDTGTEKFTYRGIKSVSFAPEYDPTLNTLTICEFTAEIETTSPAGNFKGLKAALYEDRVTTANLLAGAYSVSEAEQIGHNIVRVKAQSLLAYLDKRVLPAKWYDETITGESFFMDLMYGETEETGTEYIIWDADHPPIKYYSRTLPSDYSGYCHGLFPRQTARERLQMWCQEQGGALVAQWGPLSVDGLVVMQSGEMSTYGSKSIALNETYVKPKLKKTNNVSTVRVTGYKWHTDIYHRREDGWEKYVFKPGWTDPDTGLTYEESAVYYVADESTFTYSGTMPGLKDVVEIKNNLYLAPQGFQYSYISSYFLHYEVELDALCWSDNQTDNYYFPDDMVRFYLDAESGNVYEGKVKSVQYTFGTMARAKLVILTDLQLAQ